MNYPSPAPTPADPGNAPLTPCAFPELDALRREIAEGRELVAAVDLLLAVAKGDA